MVASAIEVPKTRSPASILGTERTGNGVVINDDGLVLTIGYLITEAETIWLTMIDFAVSLARIPVNVFPSRLAAV